MQFHLTLSPAQNQYLLKPGASFTQAYQITNDSTSTLILNTALEPWQPTGTDGSVNYNPYLENPYLQFSLNNADLRLGQTFRLGPGQSRQLVLKVHALPQATPTDAYYTFFVYQDQNSLLSPDNTGSSTTAKIGSHLLLTISNTDQIQPQASFSQLTVQPLLKDSFFGQITLSGQIDNLSDHFFQSGGKISLSKSGLVQKELIIYPQNVLTRHSRQILCQDASDPPLPAPCTLSPPLWPGVYTASFSLDSPITSASVSFFVFPYWLFLLISLTAAAVFLFVTKKKQPTP